VSELETATIQMSSPRIIPTDWKLRFETLQFEHKGELERIRLHYEHELKEKVIGKLNKKYRNINTFIFI
jgi:hypothetical protein